MHGRTDSQLHTASGRTVSLGPGLPPIPESLLLAHARGDVLFLCGAGVSRQSGLPDFRQLVRGVYKSLDPTVHEILPELPGDPRCPPTLDCSRLNARQKAEVKRFIAGEFDVILGMLERRLDRETRKDSSVRATVVQILRESGQERRSAASGPHEAALAPDGTTPAPRRPYPAPIHRALIRLANRGAATTIMTTNFDLALEDAARRLRVAAQTYALGSIPRPTRRTDFAGVLHIHGALSPKLSRHSDLILTDQDFGEVYLRRRIVPDLIYDAARLFNLVLVGYRADDPPMRYLLNAVAADEARFDDLKDRYVFVGTRDGDTVKLEDWRARGIIPIAYDASDGNHSALLRALERWAALSAINGKQRVVDREIKRIVQTARVDAQDGDRTLFDHLFRRVNPGERVHLAEVATAARAEPAWLDAIMAVSTESDRE